MKRIAKIEMETSLTQEEFEIWLISHLDKVAIEKGTTKLIKEWSEDV